MLTQTGQFGSVSERLYAPFYENKPLDLGMPSKVFPAYWPFALKYLPINEDTKYIILTRNDKIDCAISRVLAYHTNDYHEASKRIKQDYKVAYYQEEVQFALNDVLQDHKYLKTVAETLPPDKICCTSYEAVFAEPPLNLFEANRIIQWLGGSRIRQVPKLFFQKGVSPTKQRFKQQYLRDVGAIWQNLKA
jgi:hypothetical protein